MTVLNPESMPPTCRWLKVTARPDMRSSNWTEAVCVRIAGEARVVKPAKDCVGCRYWEPPTNR